MTDQSELRYICKYLYHYTTLRGLKGIINSRCLWATDYRFLNDSVEVVYANDILRDLVLPRSIDRLRSLYKGSLAIKRRFKNLKNLEVFAEECLKEWMDSMYDVSYYGQRRAIMASRPLFVSFCDHSKDSHYVQRSGLLSQWRGYGAEDGCAIVFERDKIEHLLHLDYDKYHMWHANVSHVLYCTDDGIANNCNIDSLTKGLIDLIIYTVQFNKVKVREQLDLLYPLFTYCTTLIKHQAFLEEREVRAVVIPISRASAARMSIMCNEKLSTNKEFIDVKERNNAKYMEICQDTRLLLAIKKIIVGPSNRQRQLLTAVNEIAQPWGIEVVASQTPLLRHG